MKKTKSVLLMALLVSISMFAKGQTPKDTANAACMYVTDSATFTVATGWLKKVTTYEYQFLQQQAPPGVDSFTVKKTKVPVKYDYYFVNHTSAVAPKLGKEVWIPARILVEFRYP